METVRPLYDEEVREPSKAVSTITLCGQPFANKIPDDLLCFRHKPLTKPIGHIRLLEVLKSTDGRIRCKTHEVALSQKPQYVALSYTWDRDGRHAYVECDGMLMRVGRNVWHFLLRYQDRTTPGLIWIDAICINQDDTQERNHQVDQMRDLYSSAQSVIVWLGEDSSGVAPAFQAIYRSAKLGFQHDADSSSYISEAEGSSLIGLFQRPYWKRVWIVQEFILARDVEILCGDYSVDQLSFRALQAVLNFEQSLWLPTEQMEADLENTPGWTVLRHRSSWRQDFTLRSLLQSFSKSLCSDVRDKIYGFLGLASIETEHEIAADYRKSAVEIAVVVIRSQCRPWGLPEDNLFNHDFVSLLLQWLETSHAELAAYVLEHVPDLTPYLGIFSTKELAETPMVRVSTVVASGFCGGLRPRRDSSVGQASGQVDPCSQIDDQPVFTGIWNFNYLVDNLIGELLRNRNQDYLRLIMPSSVGLTTQEHSTEEPQPVPSFERSALLNCRIRTSDCTRQYGHYITHNYSSGSPWNVSAGRIFFGTSNIIGIAHDDTDVTSQDSIVAVPGQQKALVLRKSSHNPDYWMIRGTAIVYYYKLHHIVQVADHLRYYKEYDSAGMHYIYTYLMYAGRKSDTCVQGWTTKKPLQITEIVDNDIHAVDDVFKLACQPLHFYQLMRWGLLPGRVNTDVSPDSLYSAIQERSCEGIAAGNCRHPDCSQINEGSM